MECACLRSGSFSPSLYLVLFGYLQKRFVKGLRQYGKNFFRIRKDLLPHKDTVSGCSQLIIAWRLALQLHLRPHGTQRRTARASGEVRLRADAGFILFGEVVARGGVVASRESELGAN